MAATNIEWTDAVWNPTTGCSKGCGFCYTRPFAENRLKNNPQVPHYADGFKPTCYPDRLEIPLRWTRKPRRIFVDSMGDLFDPAIPFEFIDQVMNVIDICRRHSFQVLTKFPDRMQQYVQRVAGGKYEHRDGSVFHLRESDSVIICGRDWPLPNLWLGVTVTNQPEADERLPVLLRTPAALRFVSIEPLLGPVSFGLGDEEIWQAALTGRSGGIAEDMVGGFRQGETSTGGPRLDWVIVGGMTGPKARPMHPEWVRCLRDQCEAAAVPFFFKGWGEWAPQCNGPFQPRKYTFLNADGRFDNGDNVFSNSGWSGVGLVGKKSAGDHLDGRQWKQIPTTQF